MNYDNGLYAFSEVPGFDSSKGERLGTSCNVNMNMNNLGSSDIASEVVVSESRDVEIADILVGMPVESVVTESDEQPLVLQPLLDASSQGIILQPQEEIVGADSENEGLSAYESIPVSTSDVILDTSSGHSSKRSRKSKKSVGKTKIEPMTENKRVRKWDRKQVQIKTLEGISKSFQKLMGKIKKLEHDRMHEKNLKELQPTDSSDVSLLDVKSELLLTQLRYLREHVRNYMDSAAEENLMFEEFPEPSVSDKSSEEHLNSIGETNVGVQTVDCHIPPKNSFQSSPNPPSHYHLKLNDVPFILGTSSTASHSVVANVQNIIGMMKLHNKALCAPKMKSKPKPTAAVGRENEQMLKDLSSGLKHLSVKHDVLQKKFDDEHLPRHIRNTGKCGRTRKMLHTQEKESSCDQFLHEVPKSFKPMTVSRVRRNTSTGECHVPANTSVKQNTPNFTRKKILHSLQAFKSQLSEEDITWN